MKITPTRHGLRLSQHGVVITELRRSPGPTHSVFDILAALLSILSREGGIGVLGFAAGGIVAPLAALNDAISFDAVDLDKDAYRLFCTHCPHWLSRVRWHQGDAAAWLQCQPHRFGLLLDDLSVPVRGDVFKPDISWDPLPKLIQSRLRPKGIAMFNLLLSPGDNWVRAFKVTGGRFGSARIIHLDDFQNRILVAGDELPSGRELNNQMNGLLRQIKSRQAQRFQVRKLA